MKRRNFITASILAAPFMAFAKWTNLSTSDKSNKALVVRANENRFLGKKTTTSGDFGRCIISSADTQNQFYMAGTGRLENKKKGGPGMHIHHQDDETFYVVSGEFLFQIEEEVFLGKTGDTFFIPRGTAHTFANPIDDNPGELLTIHQPISPSLETFYEVFSRIGYMDDKMLRENFTKEVLEDLMRNNAFVGPPIDIEAALKKLKN
ncbi:MAG: cupin domain-containing protein [Pedobacter sp.]|nr:MAG: cupin domain-containing protein [Pedobacter sp.]